MTKNRSIILNVALNLFALHGYDGVGIQQIVIEAGVTKPTLYHYFGSKKGLFEAVITEKSINLFQEIEEATKYQGDIVQSITQITSAYFDISKRQPMFYRLAIQTWFSPSSSEIHEAISKLHNQQFKLIEQLFILASTDHGNMQGRHRQYAVSLRGMIDTYIGLSLQGFIELDSDELIYRVVHQFLHGIFS